MTEDRIITGLEMTTGEAADEKELASLVEKSKKAGIEVKEIIGDKAYSGRDNLNYGKEKLVNMEG